MYTVIAFFCLLLFLPGKAMHSFFFSQSALITALPGTDKTLTAVKTDLMFTLFITLATLSNFKV